MKKILLATSALVMTAGVAAAEVTLSGDARMGIIDDFGAGEVAFTSRARVAFTLSGESDSGFSFGASFRADNAGGAASGTAGKVFATAGGFTASMGDVDGAANAAVGHVSGVGLTGLGDLNESTFIGNGGTNFDAAEAPAVSDTTDPSLLLEYAAGSATLYASITNPSGTVDAYALGVKYAAGPATLSLGYETVDGTTSAAGAVDIDHVIVGVDYAAGPVTLKARYGQADGTLPAGAVDGDQWAVSADYTANALTLTAFASDDSELGGVEAYGVGASYDLGGGAKVVGGYVKNQTADTNAVDLGLSFSF